jgi:hypothetical protein
MKKSEWSSKDEQGKENPDWEIIWILLHIVWANYLKRRPHRSRAMGTDGAMESTDYLRISGSKTR